MRYLRKIEWKTKRNRIRNQTIRIGLGIIINKEMIKLAHLSWSGHVVRMRDDRLTIMAWQAGTQCRDTKEGPDRLGKKG